MSSLFPLLMAAAFPSESWMSVVVSLFLLGLLGSILGRTVRGSPIKWAAGLFAGGLFVTILGFELHIM
jgi:VIT1/CCC1 family predicted Fe2+/Mn2+ transporter